MKKKAIIVSVVAALALALAVVGCSPSNSSTSSSSSSSTTKHANAKFIAAEDLDNSYDSYQKLVAQLSEVSTYTQSYGDSNPHANVHNAVYTCDNCHNDDAEMTVKDDMVCKNCHAWPRDLQSDITKMQS